MQLTCDGGLRILVVGARSCLLVQWTRPSRLAAALVDHSNSEGPGESKNVGVHAAGAIDFDFKTDAAARSRATPGYPVSDDLLFHPSVNFVFRGNRCGYAVLCEHTVSVKPQGHGLFGINRH